jgi:hypothetical protein
VTEARGTVINLHRLGATVRLADGTLAAVPIAEVTVHHAAFSASLNQREPLALVLESRGRHRAAFLARGATERPQPVAASAASLHDSAFEEQMRLYLKATEEWAPPDRPPPAERHFIRKKRRAAYFEARTKGT